MHSYIRTLDTVNGIASELTTKADFTPVNAGTTYGIASA